jgi:hypothetical protein
VSLASSWRISHMKIRPVAVVGSAPGAPGSTSTTVFRITKAKWSYRAMAPATNSPNGPGPVTARGGAVTVSMWTVVSARNRSASSGQARRVITSA